jgi:hypothetical protein
MPIEAFCTFIGEYMTQSIFKLGLIPKSEFFTTAPCCINDYPKSIVSIERGETKVQREWCFLLSTRIKLEHKSLDSQISSFPPIPHKVISLPNSKREYHGCVSSLPLISHFYEKQVSWKSKPVISLFTRDLSHGNICKVLTNH